MTGAFQRKLWYGMSGRGCHDPKCCVILLFVPSSKESASAYVDGPVIFTGLQYSKTDCYKVSYSSNQR